MMMIPMTDRLYQRLAHGDDTNARQTTSEGGYLPICSAILMKR